MTDTQPAQTFRPSLNTVLRDGIRSIALLLLVTQAASLRANALEDWVRRPDDSFGWQKREQQKANGFTVTHLEMQSQTWRGHLWTHHMQVVRPPALRHRDIAFLFITGDGDGRRSLWLLQALAQRAGAMAAVLTRVPNQPLYEGRKEDALIAYTFDQYLRTGDPTWPLLFPMAKSAVRAMDALQAFARQEEGLEIKRFVVGGASKRGWTTWLTGAVDRRVKGIAPMVIDMLNMSVQVKWAQRVYGRQSEQIHDYTELGLTERMDEPAMARLRSWVDPYSYAGRYTIPKLLLLGTNDPYWTVDSLRHYWPALPEPKLVYQTPNAGHGLDGGREASRTLAAFFQMIADGDPLPRMQWEMGDHGKAKARVRAQLDRGALEWHLWTADSADRDFRDAEWSWQTLPLPKGSKHASAEVPAPSAGYRAYMLEAVLQASTGDTYKISTEARVTPDNIRLP